MLLEINQYTKSILFLYIHKENEQLKIKLRKHFSHNNMKNEILKN